MHNVNPPTRELSRGNAIIWLIHPIVRGKKISSRKVKKKFMRKCQWTAGKRSLEISSATPVPSLHLQTRYLVFSTRCDWKHALATTYRTSARYVRFSCCFSTDRAAPLTWARRELLRKSRLEKVKRIEYSPSGYLSAPFSDPSRARAPPCHIASVSASNMQITSFFRAEKPIFSPPSWCRKRERERKLPISNFIPR